MKFVKLKNIVSRKITDGPHVSPDYVDIGVPFISGSEISGGKVVLRDGTKMISEMLHNVFYKRTPTRKNDILLVKNGSIGNCAFVDTDLKFSIWVPLALIRVKDSYNPKYVYYTIISEKTQTYLRENASETAQPNLSISTINNILVQNIDINSQNKIALFLDENCYKIDNEVALLQKKSILLDEYKNALIYETVTKGLDKNAEIKDSGVEWIGEIPKHWSVNRLKNCVQYLKLNKAELNSSNYLEIGDVDVKNNDYDINEKEKFSVDNAKIAPEGVLLISTVRPSRKAITITKYEHPVSNAFCTLKCNKYWFYLIKTDGFVNELVGLNKSSIYPTCKDVDILNQAVCIPPKEEQDKIYLFLDHETKKIEKQIELINKKVELLKEYKQSLIYEAVTGQLEIE